MEKINFNQFELMVKEQAVKEFDFEGTNIKVAQYLPVESKLELITTIVEGCRLLDARTGFYFYGRMLKTIFFSVYMVNYYSNIEIDEDAGKTYNTLKSIGLLDIVMFNIPASERYEIEEGVYNKIQEETELTQREDSLGNVIKSIFTQFDSKFLGGLEALKDFDPTKLTQLNDLKNIATGSTEEQPVSIANRKTRRKSNKSE